MSQRKEKQLAQLRPSGTGAVLLFQGKTGVQYRNLRLVVANVSNGNVDYSVFHDKDGTTYDETTALLWEIRLPRRTSDILELDIPINDSSGAIGVQIDSADDINFTLYGEELAQSR